MIHKDNNPFDQCMKLLDEKNKGAGSKAKPLKFNYSKFLFIIYIFSVQTPLRN